MSENVTNHSKSYAKPSFSTTNTVIGDSGASGSYFAIKDRTLLNNITKDEPNTKINIQLPNGDYIKSSHSGLLNIKGLSRQARKVHLFPHLQGSLLGFGPLCDDGCSVILDKHSAQVIKDGTTILSGSRSGKNDLWYMDLAGCLLSKSVPEKSVPKISVPKFLNDKKVQSPIITVPTLTLPVPQKIQPTAILQKKSHTCECLFCKNNGSAHIIDYNMDLSKCVCNGIVLDLAEPGIPLQANLSKHMVPEFISNDVRRRLKYFHSTFGSPPKSAFLNAIKRDFFSLPGITAQLITKHLFPQEETDCGGMKRKRQGLDSTKVSNEVYFDYEEPRSDINTETIQNHTILYKLIPNTGITHADATGHFEFADGSKSYDLVFYNKDSNYIHVESFNYKNDTDYSVAFQAGIKFFHDKKMSLDIFRLDSEHYGPHQEVCAKHNITIQLVPPDEHRANEAERAIQTWKSCKISMLAGIDPLCPERIFNKINKQCEMVVNLLRRSGVSEHMSAWQQLHGRWNYNQNPMAPVGMKVQIFRSRAHRETTWSTHSLAGWYVGPAMPYKACYEIYVSSTRKVRVSDTVNFYPTDDFLMPGSSPQEDVLSAFHNLTEAVTQMVPLSSQPNTKSITNFVSSLNRFKMLFLDDNNSSQIILDDDPPPGYQPRLMETTSTTPITHSSITALAGTVDELSSKSPIIYTQAPTQIVPAVVPRHSIRIQNQQPRNYHDMHHTGRALSAFFKDPDNFKKLVAHRGTLNNPKRPLQFRVRFLHSSATYDKWLPLDDVINTVPYLTYISSTSYLKNLFKFSQVSNAEKLFNRGDTVIYTSHNNEQFTAIILKVHMEDMNDINYTIQIGDDDTRIINTLPYRLHVSPTATNSHFQSNSDTSDTEDIPWYKLKLLNAIHADHHGLKYIDGGQKTLKYDKARQGPDGHKWRHAFSDELDRLHNRRKTIKFITKAQLEKGRTVSYYNPQLTEKPKNGILEQRVRGTYGGNITDFSGNKTSYTASLPSVKILLNAVISDPDSKFMTIDLKDFFLHGTLDRKEYMRIPLKWFSSADMIKYKINTFIEPGDTSVLVEVNGNMYGLVNASLVANRDIKKLLHKNNFVETNTPSIYKHKTRNIQFSLVVDDFGVKYNETADAEFLIEVLEKEYETTVDWTGKLYLGMKIDLDRHNQTLSISMEGYIQRLLARFQLPYKFNTDNPLPYQSPQYGQKVQYVTSDISPKIDDARKKIMQQAIGGLLYYSRAVALDYTLGVNKMSSRQSDPTEQDWKDFLHLMSFAATWPDCKIRYFPSDMILIIDADVSYLSETLARSRGGGVAYMGKKNDPTFINGPIDVMCVILPTIVSSACEGEYATAFLMAQLSMPLRVQLADLGYKQDMFTNGSTLLTTDNQCAEGIANESIKLKRSRAMDMRYHWLRDRVKLGDFTVKWRKNTHSLADFFTKVLPTKQFQEMRKKFIVPGPRSTLYKSITQTCVI